MSQNKGNTWKAYVHIPDSEHRRAHQVYLGTFFIAKDAARVADRARLVLHGRNADLNFAVDNYDTDAFMLVRSQFK